MMMMIEFLVMYNKMVARRTEQADVLESSTYIKIYNTQYILQYFLTYTYYNNNTIQYIILYFQFSGGTPKVFHSSSPKQNTYTI